MTLLITISVMSTIRARPKGFVGKAKGIAKAKGKVMAKAKGVYKKNKIEKDAIMLGGSIAYRYKTSEGDLYTRFKKICGKTDKSIYESVTYILNRIKTRKGFIKKLKYINMIFADIKDLIM